MGEGGPGLGEVAARRRVNTIFFLGNKYITEYTCSEKDP
jgi:hypothetical protein